MKFSLLIFFGVMISESSCLIAQNDSTKITGSYEVMSVEQIETANARLECTVLDKISNKPIHHAAIYIESLGVADFTNERGLCEFEFAGGEYIINVINVGHTSIHTDTLALKPSTMTRIVFSLGTVSIE